MAISKLFYCKKNSLSHHTSWLNSESVAVDPPSFSGTTGKCCANTQFLTFIMLQMQELPSGYRLNHHVLHNVEIDDDFI